MGLYNKDAFGGFWEVPTLGSLSLESHEVSLYALKGASCPGVISVSGLINVGDLLLERSDQGKEENAIRNHGNWIALGESVLAM